MSSVRPLAIRYFLLSAAITLPLTPVTFAQKPPNADSPAEFSATHKALDKNSFKAELKFAPEAWPPAEVDAALPSVAPDVSCPLSDVLRGASQHAQEFAANLEKFTATENIQSADVRGDGSLKRPQSYAFNYMALVSHMRNGALIVDESREQNRNHGATATPVHTTGLATTTLIFHPQYAGDFNMVCEGLGEWKSQRAWLVHFAQRPELTPKFQSIHVGRKWFRVKLKGRAWISANNFQVAHIETDLQEPIPQIRLFTEHMSVDYRAVNFMTSDSQLWLPENVNFYLDLGAHRFFYRHQLSDFLLFSVETKQEMKPL